MSGLMIPPREYHGEVITYGPHVPDPVLDAWKSRDALTTQAEYVAAGGYILDVTIDDKRSVIDFQTLKTAEIRKLLPKAKRTRRVPATKRHSAPQREEAPKVTATTPAMPCPFCDVTFAFDASDAFRAHIVQHMTTPAPAIIPIDTTPLVGTCDGCGNPQDGPGLYCKTCDPTPDMRRSMHTQPEPRPANVTPIRKRAPGYDATPQANPTKPAALTIYPEPRRAPMIQEVGIDRDSDTEEVAAWCAEHHLPAYIVGRWVWIQWDTKPATATLALVKNAGFRWVNARRAWAHNCGYHSKKGAGDPRDKYGAIPVSDDAGMVAD